MDGMIYDLKVRASTAGGPSEIIATGKRAADGTIVFTVASESNNVPAEVLDALSRQLNELGQPLGTLKRTVGDTTYEIHFARGGE
ncbi:MAG: hypothetical protein ABSG13_13445 [Bryobacteraceae bacterium]|jgi:hypothetical protein